MENIDENYLGDTLAETNPADYSAEKPGGRNFAEVLREHWFKVLMGLVVLLFAGLFLWLRSAQKAARESIDPVAAASGNIEQAIPEVAIDEIERKTPSAILEEQRKAELEARNAEPIPTGEEVVSAFVTDTAGQGSQKQRRNRPQLSQQERLTASEVGTEETTMVNTSTEKLRNHQAMGYRARGSTRSSSRPMAGKDFPQPQYDSDGTPFETNQEVLRMLSASSPQTRQVYEQTTGRRYREPRAATASRPTPNSPNPGSDGFNTYKAAGNRFSYSAGANSPEDNLTPDVFYRCVVSGEQRIRTGSVVIMRLLEDAVISGVTFPRNMVFAGVAKIEANRVTLQIDRLGPTRVKADIFDYNYMPGIMIDPEKRIAKEVDRGFGDLQRQASQEISTAIDRSASGANSVLGVAGRVAANVVSRPRTRQRLRDVLLPDGYPILITSAAAGQMGADGFQ